MTLTSQSRIWSLQRLDCTGCILRKGCSATLRDCCLRPWTALTFWRERGKRRLPLAWDIQSPLNNTLATQPNDCLLTIAPSHSWENCSSKWKVRSWSCAWPTFLLWWPEAKWWEQAESSQPCRATLSSPAQSLPIQSKTVPDGIKASTDAGRTKCCIQHRTREHFPHSHFSINKVCISLPYREISYCHSDVSDTKGCAWRPTGPQIISIQSMANCSGPHRKKANFTWGLWNHRKLPV